MNQLGDQNLTVSYTDAKGTTKTCTYKITVKDYIDHIELNPNTLTGDYGDSLSDVLGTSVTYKVYYASDMSNPVTGTVTESMITNASSYKDNVVTEQTMTIAYFTC